MDRTNETPHCWGQGRGAGRKRWIQHLRECFRGRVSKEKEHREPTAGRQLGCGRAAQWTTWLRTGRDLLFVSVPPSVEQEVAPVSNSGWKDK